MISSRPPRSSDLASPVRRLLVVDDNPDIHELFREHESELLPPPA